MLNIISHSIRVYMMTLLSFACLVVFNYSFTLSKVYFLLKFSHKKNTKSSFVVVYYSNSWRSLAIVSNSKNHKFCKLFQMVPYLEK